MYPPHIFLLYLFGNINSSNYLKSIKIGSLLFYFSCSPFELSSVIVCRTFSIDSLFSSLCVFKRLQSNEGTELGYEGLAQGIDRHIRKEMNLRLLYHILEAL